MIDELIQIAKELAYPERYAKDHDEWFTGDGPAEQYFKELSRKARVIIETGSTTETIKQSGEFKS